MQTIMDLVTDKQIVAMQAPLKKLFVILWQIILCAKDCGYTPNVGTEYSGPEAAVKDAFTGRAWWYVKKKSRIPMQLRQLRKYIVH